MIRFSCPSCQNVLEVADDRGGTKLPCGRCGQRLLVPSPAGVLNRTVEGNLVGAGVAGRAAAPARAPVKDTPWYYVRNGQRLGPVPAAQLSQLFSAGQVRPADLVWTEGMASWQPARAVSDRFAPEPELVPVKASPERPATASHSTILPSARLRPVKFKFLLLGGLTGAIGSLLTVIGLLLWRGQPAAPTQPTTEREPTTEELVAACKPSVARIDYQIAGGSGFFVDDNLVVTNSHVVDLAPCKELKILFPSAEGGKEPLTGELLYEDPNRDLAILRVPAKVKPLAVAESFTVKGGEKILIIGSPGATAGETITLENAVTQGIMSTEAKLQGLNWYQLGAPVNPGNSGGPVFDNRGRVIGVVTRKAVGPRQEGLSFAVPVADLNRALQQARSVSKADAEKIATVHDRRALYRRLALHGEQYVAAMAQMSDQATESLIGGVPAVAAFNEAKSQVQKGVKALAESRQGLAPHVPAILDHPGLKSEARRCFQDLLRLHEEMAEHIDQPEKAGYSNFRPRVSELARRHVALMKELKRHLDLAPLE